MENEFSPIVEALLFAAGRPLSARRIAEVLEVDESAVADIIGALSQALQGRGLQVVELAGGYQLGTRADHAEHLRRLRTPEPERLTRAGLETLSIVAYRQPLTRPEVDAIRGVDSSSVLATLTEKGLLKIAGRKAAPGRPLLFETTSHFLSSFGLKSLDDLPMLDALRTAAARQPALDESLASDEADADLPDDEPPPA
ncbi:MAG: SMC-Scp complex subunit ScpB [Armatimonadota bacterium]